MYSKKHDILTRNTAEFFAVFLYTAKCGIIRGYRTAVSYARRRDAARTGSADSVRRACRPATTP